MSLNVSYVDMGQQNEDYDKATKSPGLVCPMVAIREEAIGSIGTGTAFTLGLSAQCTRMSENVKPMLQIP